MAATTERLQALNRRPLDEDRWLIVFIDGFSFGQHLLVGALGVTADGTKIPLAVVEGTTENASLCTRLTANLRDRGLARLLMGPGWQLSFTDWQGLTRHDLVWTHGDGRPVHPKTFYKRFVNLMTEAGLPRIRLHDVRHSWPFSLKAGAV